MMSKTTLSVAAASAAGLAFLGYCVYFDQKRRNDPDFKQKLKEKRRQARQDRNRGSGSRLPDMTNPQEIQKFFLQEIQKGEELLASGEIEEGVEHLSNAVAVSGHPEQLLQVLQQTLPPQVIGLLLQKLPSVCTRLGTAGAGGESGRTEPPTMETGAVIDEVVD